MVNAGSTMWKPTVKANCARASRTASAPGMPTSRACRRAHMQAALGARRFKLPGGSPPAAPGSCYARRPPGAGCPRRDAPRRPGIASMAISTCMVSPERCDHMRSGTRSRLANGCSRRAQQARRCIRIEHEADGDAVGHQTWEELRTNDAKRRAGNSPAAQAAGPLIRVSLLRIVTCADAYAA